MEVRGAIGEGSAGAACPSGPWGSTVGAPVPNGVIRDVRVVVLVREWSPSSDRGPSIAKELVMKNFEDKVAVVTGAAGGIGRATAVGLAKRGCHLAVSDVNETGLEETVEQIRAVGRPVSSHVVDVADKTQMHAFAESVQAQHGPACIVVNNAGVTVTEPFADHSLEDFEWIMGINFWGVVYGCKFFLPQLKSHHEAHIVNVSSVFGLVGVPMQSSYCATKFAVRGFSESLWTELKNDNVGVTSVHPAGVKTNIARDSRSSDPSRVKMGVDILERTGVTPEYAAKRIIGAVSKNQKRLLVSRDSYIIDGFKRVAPDMTQGFIHRGFQRLLR